MMDAQGVANDPFFAVGLVIVLLTVIAFAGWNVYAIRNLRQETAVARSDSQIFIAAEGWKVGDWAPRATLKGIDGQSFSLRDVAEKHNVIYFAQDTCATCKRQFPDLNAAAAGVEAAGGSLALVSLMNESTLSEMQQQYGFTFPVYEIGKAELARLNIMGSPTILLFQRGVLVEAFTEATVAQEQEHIKQSLQRFHD